MIVGYEHQGFYMPLTCISVNNAKIFTKKEHAKRTILNLHPKNPSVVTFKSRIAFASNN